MSVLVDRLHNTPTFDHRMQSTALHHPDVQVVQEEPGEVPGEGGLRVAWVDKLQTRLYVHIFSCSVLQFFITVSCDLGFLQSGIRVSSAAPLFTQTAPMKH